MSMDDVAKFFSHVHHDADLKEKMRGTLPHGHVLSEDEVAKEVVQIGRDAGFEFTVDDYKATLHREIHGEQDEQIGDSVMEEMEAASGQCAWNSIISAGAAGKGSFFSG